jgi:hypothetical protein
MYYDHPIQNLPCTSTRSIPFSLTMSKKFGVVDDPLHNHPLLALNLAGREYSPALGPLWSTSTDEAVAC